METQIMETDLAVGQQKRKEEIDSLKVVQQFPANWYAAYTNSHHEKRVAAQFGERQIESFLPLYATRHRWRNRCDVNHELPLFPNYVFVHIAPRERVRVLEVPGVLSLVGFGGTLARLPDSEIEALRAAVGQRRIEPHPYLVIGVRVRIMAGPMMGLEGVLIRKKNNFRVVVALDAIMQCVAVEVDADDLEPAAKSAGRIVVPSSLTRPANRRPQPQGL
jgi:transcription antitermination factor NusG